MKSNKKGFTLIELMVVIVIIGILSALAIPKMFGVSSKAKASEVPTVVANFETLQSAYVQETGAAGTATNIGFSAGTSKWWSYTHPANDDITSTALTDIGTGCVATNAVLSNGTVANGDVTFAHSNSSGTCMTLMKNF